MIYTTDDPKQQLNGDDSSSSSSDDGQQQNHHNVSLDISRTKRREDSGLVLEVDDFDDYVTSTNDPDFDERSPDDQEEDPIVQNQFQLWDSTNTGEYAFNVEGDIHEKKGVMKDMSINGHVIMNQCGCLLTRKKYLINGSNKQKFFIQKICATSVGSSVPLMYPEAMIFPSIFWKSAKDNCSIAGAIPAPLLSESIGKFGFSSIPDHVRCRLTNPSLTTSSDHHYISFCYDKLTNLAANHQDTRIIIRRGLTADDKTGGLGVRGSGDSSMLESFDSKAMVRNLCASQRYHTMTHFLTFTCNMKKHFGTKPIKEWIDCREWKKMIPNFNELTKADQEEYEACINQSASGLFTRVWEEVTNLFLDYLKNSPSSPYINVHAMFTRKEFQAMIANLFHIHLMLEVSRRRMTAAQKAFIDDLCRCSIFDVVRQSEINPYIADGTLQDLNDYKSVVKDASMFLGHKCNSRCLVKTSDGKFRCRKLNYLKVSNDNTKHTYQDLPNKIPKECLDRLRQIGMVDPLQVNENGYEKPWKSKLAFLHPRRHIPPTNPNNDINMSPVEGYTFANCRSMQNIQLLTQTGGVNKYVCKYISKIDEQNYVVVKANGTDGKGSKIYSGNNKNRSAMLMTKSTFLHNTKVTSSKIQEDKDRQKNLKYPQGRYISHVEMLHQMLKYPEVITDLQFINIPTMPIEYRAGIELDSFVAPVAEDCAQTGSVSNDIRLFKENLPQWRKHTIYEMRIYEDLTKSRISVDKITLFSLRPPELRSIIDKPRHYFRWFYTSLSRKDRVKPNIIDDCIDIDLHKCWWINCLQQKVRIRRNAFPELMDYISTIEDDQEMMNNESVSDLVQLFHEMNNLLLNHPTRQEAAAEEGNHHNNHFFNFMNEHLIYQKEESHLPIPVFSYIKPTTGFQFIHHILLSMGSYSTEVNLIMHPTIRDAFRYAKLIGPSNDPTDLQFYSGQLLYKWIEDQLQYYPNSLRVLSDWICLAGELFDSIIVDNQFAISDMPPVQLSSLFGNSEEDIFNHTKSIKSTFIEAIKNELDVSTFERCNIPSKEDILNASKSSPLDWDASVEFCQSSTQSTASFEEQQKAIQLCCQQINKYCNLADQSTFTKNVGLRGFLGSGKTWCSLYVSLYALSKGLLVMSVALLAKRGIQIGGTHWHKLYCIPTERHFSIHRRAELALLHILRDEKKHQTLLTVDILICDEIGEFDTFLSFLLVCQLFCEIIHDLIIINSFYRSIRC